MIKAMVTRKPDCNIIEFFTEKESFVDADKLLIYNDFVRFGFIIADKCVVGNHGKLYTIDCKNGIIFDVNEVEIIKDGI